MIRERAVEVVRRLSQAGHQALFAGGCVRDRLLGEEPTDYDIATSARPEHIEALFEQTSAVGKRFGIIVVTLDGTNFDVATFRHDGSYSNGRHPDSVRFTDAREDAERRDFTINAMFEDPLSGEIFDYAGGRRDLEAGRIRTVGEPARRFQEDRLRMIRAVRFAARFGFDIEQQTFEAIAGECARITDVSAERIGDELCKILTEGAARRGFELLDASGLLEHVLPEVSAMQGCPQPQNFHPEGDVFVHTMLAIEQLPPGCSLTLALGALLHDVAKPACVAEHDGRLTFYRHTVVGAEMATAICQRLRLSNAVSDRVAWLVDQHLRHCVAAKMKVATRKRFLRQHGIEELLELTRIDAMASNRDLTHYEFFKQALETFAEEPVRPQRLVSGHDLKAMGLQPGPLFRRILREVEDRQLEGTLSDRDTALAFVRRRFLQEPSEDAAAAGPPQSDDK